MISQLHYGKGTRLYDLVEREREVVRSLRRGQGLEEGKWDEAYLVGM